LDPSEANGTSIAFLAEFEGKRCLLAGDAFPTTLAAGVRQLGASDDNRFELVAFKPSHHGSRRSLNNDLLKILACNRYLISTDGIYYKHPHREAIARIVAQGGKPPRLCFNYCTPHNSVWDEPELIHDYKYELMYPDPVGGHGLRLDF